MGWWKLDEPSPKTKAKSTPATDHTETARINTDFLGMLLGYSESFRSAMVQECNGSGVQWKSAEESLECIFNSQNPC
jgi:hypothetical protein